MITFTLWAFRDLCKYIHQKKEKQYIAVGTVWMYIEPSTINNWLTHSTYATKIARIRCYTMISKKKLSSFMKPCFNQPFRPYLTGLQCASYRHVRRGQRDGPDDVLLRGHGGAGLLRQTSHHRLHQGPVRGVSPADTAPPHVNSN